MGQIMKRACYFSAIVLATSLTLGCHTPRMGSIGPPCADGSCGPSGELACTDGSCYVGDYTGQAMAGPTANASDAGLGAMSNYQVNAGHGGPLGALHGRHHRGPQSHLGAMPGPAMGPPAPTVTYPYYTTRGPRDYFLDNPPSIGR
jgi:hypothetical protein